MLPNADHHTSNIEIPKNLTRSVHKHSKMWTAFLFVLTFGVFFLSIALVRCMIGNLPIRFFLALFIFFCIFISKPSLLFNALAYTKKAILVIGLAALIGFIVSLCNATPLSHALRQILEIHIQSLFNLLIGYGLLHIIGPKRLTRAFLWVVGLSSIFAFMQAAGINTAWHARDLLQTIQLIDVDLIYLTDRTRAMGLSFSPVHLGTQICLAFAISYAWRRSLYLHESPKKFQKRTWVPCFLALSVVIASGNRSPILGFMAFIGIYMVYARPRLSFFLTLFLLPIFLFVYSNVDEIFNYLSSTGLRAFKTGDKSSEGRAVLRTFGWLLFASRPLGYGLMFTSTVHVNKFWAELAGFPGAHSIWVHAVHNYYLNVLHKYGIMILPLAFYALKVILKNWQISMAFIPYAVHIFFHNDGPLQGDFLIWYFIPYFIDLASKKEKEKRTQANNDYAVD